MHFNSINSVMRRVYILSDFVEIFLKNSFEHSQHFIWTDRKYLEWCFVATSISCLYE